MIFITEQNEPVIGSARSSNRADVIARYRQVRDISKQHHSGVIKLLSKDAILTQARRLGLTRGKTLVLDSMDDLNLAFDLAIYTAPKDRTRAIDRFARLAQLTPGSDEAVVLDAMRQARFAILVNKGRHPVAGLIVQDVFRDLECRLMDLSLETSLPAGAVLATRLYSLGDSVDGFVMTAGVLVPCDIEFFEDAVEATPSLHRVAAEVIIDDRRFAEALYRRALASGITEQISFEDTIAQAG